MTTMLYVAAFCAVGLGVAHSVLGELYVLQPLLRRGGLPPLFGGEAFTARTLRLAWHLTTVAWWGFAALLLYMAEPLMTYRSVAYVTGLTFTASALLTALSSRGRHLAWPFMLVVGAVGLVVAHA